jgi:hypothetical protein
MRRQRATYEPRGCPLRSARGQQASRNHSPLKKKLSASCLRGGAGALRKRRYLAIWAPSHRRQHPGGSLVGHGGHRGAVWGLPDPKFPALGASNRGLAPKCAALKRIYTPEARTHARAACL